MKKSWRGGEERERKKRCPSLKKKNSNGEFLTGRDGAILGEKKGGTGT